jgi:hypothetical protein
MPEPTEQINHSNMHMTCATQDGHRNILACLCVPHAAVVSCWGASGRAQPDPTLQLQLLLPLTPPG